MNRHERRRMAKEVKAAAVERGDVIAIAMQALAGTAPSATGATLFHPDGTTTYLDAEAARALYRSPTGRGDA